MQKKTLLSIILILTLTCSAGLNVSATEAEDTTAEGEAATEDENLTDEELAEKQEEEEKERQRQEAYDMPVQSNEITGWPEGPGSYAQSAIVMEAGTGAILYAKNIDEKHYPASITKVLTALVALEFGDLSDTVTMSHDSVAFLEPGDSSIGLEEGEQITLEQAMYAMLLASANEAAYAVAETVGQSLGKDYDWFIEEMNGECRKLGGVNSNFVNTNGLHDDDHYTCARDMALIGSELFKYPKFFDIVQTLEYTIPANGDIEEHTFQQKDKMLDPKSENYYEYTVGGKTGYTTKSQTTLITMAEKDGTQLVCVLLQTFPGYAYPDTTDLLEYGFNNFTKTAVAGEEHSEDIAEILTEEDEEEDTGYVMLPNGVAFSDLDMEIVQDDGINNPEATLEYTYGGNPVGSARARLSDSYLQAQEVQIAPVEEEVEPEEEETETPAEGSLAQWLEKLPDWVKSPFFIGACALVLIFLIVVIVIRIIRHRKKKKRDKGLNKEKS